MNLMLFLLYGATNELILTIMRIHFFPYMYILLYFKCMILDRQARKKMSGIIPKRLPFHALGPCGRDMNVVMQPKINNRNT